VFVLLDALCNIGTESPVKPSSATIAAFVRAILGQQHVEAALNQFAPGHQVCEADVARLSPLIHDHINMLGWYSFAMPETVAWGEL
jgi:hypothetical protein